MTRKPEQAAEPAPDVSQVSQMTASEAIGAVLAIQQAGSLPSANIQHSTVFENELQGRLHAFRSGVTALQAEMEGQQQAFERDNAERAAKHDEAKRDLLRRIADMQMGEAMASAALDAKTRLDAAVPPLPDPAPEQQP
jgi:hypothetical protein